MLKNLVQLEHVLENKVCRFVCDNDTPINFIKEALFQFQKYIGAIEDAALAQQKAQAPAEPEVSEVPMQPVLPIESVVSEPESI